MKIERLAGIELGGSKCVAVLSEGPELISRAVFPTKKPAETLEALAGQLDAWTNDAPFAALGLASFGPISLHPSNPDFGSITSSPKIDWQNTNIVEYFQKRFAVPTGFDTDVNAAALAEYRWGAARGMSCNVYLTIGTGVGGGAVVRGEPLHGLSHPEMGHIRVRRRPADDFAWICPFHGDCLEGLISGPAIAARTGRSPSDLTFDHPVWNSVAAELAELVMAMILILAPERIAIGGGVGTGQPQIFEKLRREVSKLLNGYGTGCSELAMNSLIVPAQFGADAGLLGAIALADLAFQKAK